MDTTEKTITQRIYFKLRGLKMKAIITIEDSPDQEYAINSSLQLIQDEGEEFTEHSELSTGATIAAYLMDLLNDKDIALKVDTWIKENMTNAA